MSGCKPENTPIKAGHKLDEPESPLIERERYRLLMGKLIYILHTRIDIPYVVSQFMHNPKELRIEALFRYLNA